MNLQERFLQHLQQFSFIQKKQKQLLAVSGGVDSVVLCDLMFNAQYDFVIAHCNFQLRGVESERDEQFVKSIAEKYNKEILVKRFNTEKYAAEKKVSIQVAARELRYEWFKSIVNEQWTMINDQWTMDNGQWTMNNGQWTMNNGQWTMNNGQWTMNNEQWTMDNGQWTTDNGQWTMNNGQWTIENSESPTPPTSHLTPPTSHLTSHPSSLTPPKVHHILTAHHANDNIETLLMNFFKGTGISGLHGILPVQGKIVRPLLFAKKEELTDYSKENNLSFVEDSSNQSDKYTRNFFRHKLFPILEEVYSNVAENLLNNINRFSEAEELYKQSVEQHKKKLLEFKGNEVHIPVLKLQKTSPLSTVLYEIIKDFGFTSGQVTEAVDLLKSETGKYIFSSSHRIIKNRNWLIISPLQTTEAANILIEKTDKKIIFSNGEMQFEIIKNSPDFKIPPAANIAVLDFAVVSFPLLLRKWKQGDYFYPLGMKKKKKLSRFFIDQKLSKTDKENAWIVEMDKKIIWVAGHRIDDRFKIKPSTEMILKITISL